jgi:hypothetical protein
MSESIGVAIAATGNSFLEVGIDTTASGRVVVHDQIDSKKHPPGHDARCQEPPAATSV